MGMGSTRWHFPSTVRWSGTGRGVVWYMHGIPFIQIETSELGVGKQMMALARTLALLSLVAMLQEYL